MRKSGGVVDYYKEESMGQPVCFFCEHLSLSNTILFETEHWCVRMDDFPVSQGHLNIVSQRHIPDLLSLNEDEQHEFWIVLKRTKEMLDPEFKPTGYNYGVNEGVTAGQTVMHLHFHVFPRYTGDVANPRGGIRNFKEPLIKY